MSANLKTKDAKRKKKLSDMTKLVAALEKEQTEKFDVACRY